MKILEPNRLLVTASQSFILPQWMPVLRCTKCQETKIPASAIVVATMLCISFGIAGTKVIILKLRRVKIEYRDQARYLLGCKLRIKQLKGQPQAGQLLEQNPEHVSAVALNDAFFLYNMTTPC